MTKSTGSWKAKGGVSSPAAIADGTRRSHKSPRPGLRLIDEILVQVQTLFTLNKHVAARHEQALRGPKCPRAAGGPQWGGMWGSSR